MVPRHVTVKEVGLVTMGPTDVALIFKGNNPFKRGEITLQTRVFWEVHLMAPFVFLSTSAPELLHGPFVFAAACRSNEGGGGGLPLAPATGE